MPYLTQNSKDKIENSSNIEELIRVIDNAGDMNYVITRLVHGYINKKGLRYENCNSMIGALEACKQEFYRRVVGPYEDQKIKENGDVMEIPDLKQEGKY